MAKKFGKFLFATAIVTAAAGAYMYLKKKVVDDDFDEFDDDDFDDDSDAADDSDADRSYVSLDLDSAKQEASEEAPETAGEAPASSQTEEYFDDEDPSMDAM
ncbi:MAG: hypothetical protein IKL78_03695 [Lachnospiraceae bacterium]|nr:hypothetical protein [Lachnospiraceae bacterium]